jgi:dinuclear metal center YbgI/SA1388 family protein
MIIKELTAYLESLAPAAFQEDYDNSGLIIGDPASEISAVLVTLDITDEVLEEAIQKKANLIVAHHPLIFRGLKKLNGKNYVERLVIKAIKNDIAIYAIHTNLDNVAGGVNIKIAERLGLKNVSVLRKKENTLYKLEVFVPRENTGALQNALYAAGAGNIGNPVIGSRGIYEEVEEHKVEVVFPGNLKSKVLDAMRKAHPYEEIAYYLVSLENENQAVGSGSIGVLEEAMELGDFLKYLKDKMKVSVIRYAGPPNKIIKKVAVCGGVGSFLFPDAMGAGADVFVTADYKYHEFFDADNQIVIADIGHFESEQFTKDLLVEIISKKFSNFASYLSEIDTNPIKYHF